MEIGTQLFILILAYLLGSIPTAVWIGKIFYKIDVREHGSGNAGATNTFRTLGKKAGIPTLIIDVLKGLAAVMLVFLFTNDRGTELVSNIQVASGIAALMGHIYPVFAGFRGGKGVATMLGVVLALQPLVALVAILVFAVFFFSTHYVSLSSMCAAICYPVALMVLYPNSYNGMIIFSMLVGVMVVFTHRQNIQRLLKRTESKIYLVPKKVKA